MLLFFVFNCYSRVMLESDLYQSLNCFTVNITVNVIYRFRNMLKLIMWDKLFLFMFAVFFDLILICCSLTYKTWYACFAWSLFVGLISSLVTLPNNHLYLNQNSKWKELKNNGKKSKLSNQEKPTKRCEKKKRQKEKQQSLTQCIKDYSNVKNILINQFKFCKRTNDNTCI